MLAVVKVLLGTVAGVAPVATIATLASKGYFNAPPSTKQEPNLVQTKSEEERGAKVTQPQPKSQEKQRKEDLEHNRCQDENIKVVVRDNEGKEITVPVTEASKYKQFVRALYDVGTCRRDTSAEK